MGRILRILIGSSLLALALIFGAWRLSKSRSYQVFGTLITRVETADSLIALTFDDGPSPVYTDSILAILSRTGAHATFFVIGSSVQAHTEVAQRVVAAGHELGNHSYSHHRLILKTPGYIRREIDATDSLIRAAGQVGPIPFRPPNGKRLLVLPWILSRAGRATILADLEPDSDPRIARSPDSIAEDVLARARPGSILLLHVETQSRGTGRAALPMLIWGLREKGFKIVTVSELLRHKSQ